MKKMNKAVALLCLAAVGTSAFAFTGCKKDEAGKVMNVALNPEVEFVLDANDKVVTVNALNEEGNLIISSELFVNAEGKSLVEGKSAEEAARLFVQVSQETGFLLEGNIAAGENELKISFSGDTSEAKKLYDDVKAEVESYVATLSDQITVGITQAEAITEEALKTLVAEVAPYLDVAEMEYAQLIAELEASRKETAEYYSQELKNAYYDAKAYAFEQAEYEALTEDLDGFTKNVCDTLFKVYTSFNEKVETARLKHLIAEDSIYQKALKNMRQAKIDFLNYKNYVNNLPEGEEASPEMLSLLNEKEQILNSMVTALTEAGETANDFLDEAKTFAKTAYEEVVNKLNELNLKAKDFVEEISEKQKAALTELTTEFETTYATHKAHAEQAWGDMRTALEAGYQEESAE